MFNLLINDCMIKTFIKCQKIRTTALALCVITALPSIAQTVIEGEEPAESQYAEISDRDGCSGKKAISVDAYKGAFASYIFNAPTDGTYDLTVFYVTLNTRWMSVKVNEQIPVTLCCNEMAFDWNGNSGETTDPKTGETVSIPGYRTKTLKVHMDKGDNSIILRGIYGYSPETGIDQPYSPIIDKIEIVPSNTEVEALEISPEQIIREAESADVFSGTAGIGNENRAIFSGKQGAGTGSNGFMTYIINAPEAGVYIMNMNYCTMQTRWVFVKVNRQKRSYVEFRYKTASWGDKESTDPNSPSIFQRSCLVYLEKGNNEVTIGNYTGSTSENSESPNFDKISFDLVSDTDFVKPGNEILANKASLTDIAKSITATSSIETNLICDKNEFTGITLPGIHNLTITEEMPCNFLFSGYSFSTTNNSNDWIVETSADGTTWNQITPYEKSTLSSITTAKVNPNYDAPIPAKFIRLTATSTEDINLNELQFFGNPYISSDSQFPTGIITPETSFEATYPGLTDFGETVIKLFDHDAQSRYTLNPGSSPIEITIYPDDQVKATSYSLSTAYTNNDYQGRDPQDWKLEGYDNNGNWILLDSCTNMSFVSRGSTLFRPINNATDCFAYKLTLLNRSSMTHLSEFQLYTLENSVITGITDVNANMPGEVRVSSIQKGIMINAGIDTPYAIYNISGVLMDKGVAKAGTTVINLKSGIYITKLSRRVIKTIITE